MLSQVAYSIVLVFATVCVHAACTTAWLHWLEHIEAEQRILKTALRRAMLLSAVVFLMTAAAVLESSFWAVLYLWVGALPTANEALYFSLVTFTTLGYGDVTLSAQWRILGAFQAANGVIMFGWTTALIVFLVQRIYHLRQRTPAA